MDIGSDLKGLSMYFSQSFVEDIVDVQAFKERWKFPNIKSPSRNVK